MNILVIGAGFTGLTAAYELLKAGGQVTIVEKEDKVGGLAVGFKMPGWDWAIEHHYHHWFANDLHAINLIKEVGLGKDLFFKDQNTDVFLHGKIYPFNSPKDILQFEPLPYLDRSWLGLLSLLLKTIPATLAIQFEKVTAYEWIAKYYGEKNFKILWKPLLDAKFGPYAKTVNMAWFWARIKKRTFKLGYLAGGYQRLSDQVAELIRHAGGKILLSTQFDPGVKNQFEKIIVTTPSVIFTKLFPNLPKDYSQRISSIPHLHALNLLLISEKPFLPKTYWLNINEPGYPFVCVAQHTNFVDSKHYGGKHLTWIGNYLPPNHPYLKMTKKELFKLFLPYLKKINPTFNYGLRTMDYELFMGPFAQPVFPVNYSKTKPVFKTPLANVYLANMDMVYPWDRGTNYAIELGQNIAKFILNNSK